MLVSGAPGSGRTTLAREMAARRVEAGFAADDVLVISASRTAAAQMRQDLSARLKRTSSQPPARSAASTAFAIVRAWAVANNEPPPVLVSGPEQDAVLAELIEGHLAGEGVRPPWPDSLPTQSLRLTGFRAELRDLLMRAAEYGLAPEELIALGERHSYQPWIAGGMVYSEYLNVTSQRWSTPDAGQRFDAAGIVDSATNLLAMWEEDYAQDPTGPLPPPPRWKTVIVDDYQEATAATVRLLDVMQSSGAELLLFGDPDVAVQTFRGAQPALLARAMQPRGSELGAFGAQHIVLEQVWGQTPQLRRVTQLITPVIGSIGLVDHRKAASAVEVGASASDVAASAVEVNDDSTLGSSRGAVPPAAQVAIANSPAREISHAAYELRRAHVVDGLDWRQMAVIVRSGAQADEVRRGLLEHGVPILDETAEVLLRAEPAVQPLLMALEYAVTAKLEPPDVLALLRSPVGGLDSVELRRLRRALWNFLRHESMAQSVDEALVDLMSSAVAISLPASIRRPVTRVATMLQAARAAAEDRLANVESVLWAAWDATGLARIWQDQAIAGAIAGRQADRDLDAVLALFAAAGRFVERMPGASIAAFIRQIRSESLPADSLAARATGQEGVAVLTPAAAAGNRWDFVCILSVQADVWPDVRLRDTVLGAQRLTEVLTGRAHGLERDFAAARREVLHDEARSFLLAISRARSRLLVSAVADPDADLLPSAFIDVLQSGDVPVTEAVGMGDPNRVPVSLRELVAVLRRASLDEQDPQRQAAAEDLLAFLARHEVAGANPQSWNGTAQLTTTAPLADASEPVYMSPSRLDSFITCPLRWALEQAGGTRPATIQQDVGNLIHELAAELFDGTEAQLLARLDEKWPSLGLPTGWVGIVKRAEVERSVQRLAQYIAEGRSVVSVEEKFELEVGRARITGVADRIERTDSGALRVVDFKTGSYADKDEIPRHSQLGIYQLAVQEGRFAGSERQSAGAALVYVSDPNKGYKQFSQLALAEDEDPHWVHKRVTETAEQMAGSTFLARENPGCRSCPVRRSCPLQNEGGRVL